MAAPSADLDALPEQLAWRGEVPRNGIFFDTNAVLHRAQPFAVSRGRIALISSLVYAELTRRNLSIKGLAALDANLQERGVKIVDFDAASSRLFFDVCRRLHFDRAPLARQQETRQACFDRLRFDVAVFAAALRHERLLVTDNRIDFEHFPFPDCWVTTTKLLADPAFSVPPDS